MFSIKLLDLVDFDWRDFPEQGVGMGKAGERRRWRESEGRRGGGGGRDGEDDDVALTWTWRMSWQHMWDLGVNLIHFVYLRGKCDPKKSLGANLILA